MSKGAFRGWVVASILLAVAWVVSDFATARLLPDELRAFHDAEPEFTPTLAAVLFLALGLLVLFLVASVGLLLFWRPARVLYLIGSLGGFGIAFFLGPTISTALTNGIAYLDCAVSGFILALLYFSPIRAEFDRPPSVAP